MKLSVLISTYNCTCYRLVWDLNIQLEASGMEYEVIVMDDGSRDQVSIIANRKINELRNCRYIYNKDNVGRAAIRNLLADRAKGEWLLFMDSDAKVVREDYIVKYKSVMDRQRDDEFYYGGICHIEECLDPDKMLRWKYEQDRKSRHKEVSKFFSSFNFMIAHKTFDSVRFDETFSEYGGEDTKFGIDAKAKGLRLIEFDNPLMHTGLDSNEEYLRKVEMSLRSIKLHEADLASTMILTFVREHRITSYMAWILYKTVGNRMKKNLLGGDPSMRVLALYKLGYLMSI